MASYGKIVVLAGGPSSEREISLKSGRAVFDALKRQRQEVDFLDVDSDFHSKIKNIDAALVFIALHGKFGEDGSVQTILEESNLPYTGSGARASRLALDKIASRELFLTNGLSVPKYMIVRQNAEEVDITASLEVPFVVKPQHEGSSIGLSIVSDKIHARQALEMAFGYGKTAIVEEYIHGRELTVGILEERALPIIEIVTKHNVYDFDAKYLDEGTKYIVPAELKEEDSKRAQELALKAHKALGCRDFSRVDMRMDSGGNIYVLEINTIPGMTQRSLLPKAAAKAGITFEDLCLKLVELAYRRGSIRPFGG
ncbi:MAG: D-alanine--D-alanine ligase [Candidatus Omnitrophica bacterium]|nr:D-alanine--D-alanine ligase [Candidatus Omnitrophota bacterium]